MGFLSPVPGWEVRIARVGDNATEAAVAGAEEWLASQIHPSGRHWEPSGANDAPPRCAPAYSPDAFALSRSLPESRPGANLSEAEAREAVRTVLARHGLT
eukprot:6247707-Prymnesium_polylepis.1